MKTCLSTDSRTLDWVQFGSVTNNAVANTFVCVSGFSIEYVHRIEPLSRYICMFTALAGIANFPNRLSPLTSPLSVSKSSSCSKSHQRFLLWFFHLGHSGKCACVCPI